MTEISAETLLGHLYPELQNRWTVRNEGAFYRNYNNDVMEILEEENSVSLSRNGLLQLLPDALISDVDELKGKGIANYEAVKMRRHTLQEAFVPYDTFVFRNNLRLERKVSALLESKLQYILKAYFCFDLQKEENPYVREVAGLLPFVSSRRGDLNFISMLLHTLTGCEVEMDMSHRYSETDSTRAWMPMIRYNILKEGMDKESYIKESALLKPLEDFLTEWFLPFDVKARITYKQHGIHPTANGSLILDYNTEL